MISLTRPSDEHIARFRERMLDAQPSYAEVGASRGDELPPGYRHDRHELVVGRGERDLEAATEALFAWRHYDAPSAKIRALEPRPVVEQGAVVILLARHVGVYTLSACRVVYSFREPTRRGFGYGTLEHAVRGEERFEVALRDDGAVVLRLAAFSVPAHWLIRLGQPVARHYQAVAAEDYARGLKAAVSTI